MFVHIEATDRDPRVNHIAEYRTVVVAVADTDGGSASLAFRSVEAIDALVAALHRAAEHLSEQVDGDAPARHLDVTVA